MKVKPILDYHLLGTSIRLKAGKTYTSIHATNQPNWKKEGKVFVNGVLLVKGEYIPA